MGSIVSVSFGSLERLVLLVCILTWLSTLASAQSQSSPDRPSSVEASSGAASVRVAGRTEAAGSKKARRHAASGTSAGGIGRGKADQTHSVDCSELSLGEREHPSASPELRKKNLMTLPATASTTRRSCLLDCSPGYRSCKARRLSFIRALRRMAGTIGIILPIRRTRTCGWDFCSRWRCGKTRAITPWEAGTADKHNGLLKRAGYAFTRILVTRTDSRRKQLQLQRSGWLWSRCGHLQPLLSGFEPHLDQDRPALGSECWDRRRDFYFQGVLAGHKPRDLSHQVTLQ